MLRRSAHYAKIGVSLETYLKPETETLDLTSKPSFEHTNGGASAVRRLGVVSYLSKLPI